MRQSQFPLQKPGFVARRSKIRLFYFLGLIAAMMFMSFTADKAAAIDTSYSMRGYVNINNGALTTNNV